jgi:predicted nucleic acid-binding protein
VEVATLAIQFYLAEQKDIDTVFTLDYRDFSVYRFKKNKPLKLIPDPGT